jgi:hypothetical protein
MKRLIVAVIVCTASVPVGSTGYAASAKCPANTLRVTNADRPAAKRAVLRFLQRTYRSPALVNGKPLKGDLLRGARLTARLASNPQVGFGLMPRLECGSRVWRRTMIVAAYLPAVARQAGADLAQLTFFVSRTASRWVVWERAH